MRRASVIAVISASTAVANQLNLLPAQQPVDPAALLDGDTSKLDLSNLQITNDNMLNLKPNVDQNDIVQQDDQNAMLRSDQSPLLTSPLEQDREQSSIIDDFIAQALKNSQQPANTDPKHAPEVLPQSSAHHHTHHHTHSSYKNRQRNMRHRRATPTNVAEPWKGWQASNQWSVDAASRTVYPDRTDLPVPITTQTETLVRANAVPTGSSAGASSSTAWNPGLKSIIKSHEDVESEDDLIAFNLAQAELDLDLASVGGSYHDNSLGGGSSNTQYQAQGGNSVDTHRSGAFGIRSSEGVRKAMRPAIVAVIFALADALVL